MSRSFIFRALILILALMLSGCGGGGSAPGGSSARTAIPRLMVNWPVRSRSLDSFAAALSVVFRLKGAGIKGGDITFTVNRANQAAGYTETYLSPTEAKVGAWQLEAAFHAERDGSGAVVGTATGPVMMDAQGNLPDIATQGTIAQVQILPGQVIKVGQKADLAFQALDASGGIIAVTAGSLQYAVSSGLDKARFVAGYVEGLAPGSAVLIPSIGSVTGPPQVVKVASDAALTVTPNPATVGIGGTIPFQATVTNAPDTRVTWSVNEGSGGGTITGAGVYTAPNTAGVYHVNAASVYDPDKRVSIIITVADGGAEVGVDFPPSGGADVIID